MTGEDFERSHRESFESLGAYALGALSEQEAAAVEGHLGACERCREDLVALKLAAGTLPAAAPPVSAPPGLRASVMAVVESEAELLHAAGSDADRVPRPRRSPWWLRFYEIPRPALAGLAAVLALAVAGGVLVAGGSSGGEATTVQARVLLGHAGAGARATLRTRNGHGTLLVRDLPAPPAERVYELWVKRGSAPPVPAGATFVVRSGAIEIPHSMRGVRQVMVTPEPVGGSATPTGPQVIVASPA